MLPTPGSQSVGRRGARFPTPADFAPSLDDVDFARIAEIVYDETGIVITPAKRNMVVARLSRRLRELAVSTFAEYRARLERDGEERRELVSAITTNVTKFFREFRHFQTLSSLVPDMARRARAGGRVRLWSAGCATGQEAYSMAMVLLQQWADAARYDVKILATDIDPRALAEARRGVYPVPTPSDEGATLVRRYTVPGPDPGTIMVSEGPRALIRFEELNLLREWPFSGRFDVIFYRNVVIYFDETTRRRLWYRLAERLLPGGWLFVGHSERVDPQLENLLQPAGVTQYRRLDGPARDHTGIEAIASPVSTVHPPSAAGEPTWIHHGENRWRSKTSFT